MNPRKLSVAIMLLLLSTLLHATETARYTQTPYTAQKVVYDFYFDEPEKMAIALYWLRSLLNPLMDEPYATTPEEHRIKVVIHGTEIVTLARKNYKKYKDIVERMRYYAEFGVEFKACGLVMDEYGYRPQDFYPFVEVVPSAITELVHWQMQGYGLIRPTIMEKHKSIEEIR